MHVVLYDGECSFCAFQMRVLSRIDWFGVFQLLPYQDLRSTQVASGIAPEELREAIHCVTPDGRVYRSARCLRFVGLRLPLLVPIALVLWIPGALWLAERFYAMISRNRYRISRWFGCQGACVIPAKPLNNCGEIIGIKADNSGPSRPER